MVPLASMPPSNMRAASSSFMSSRMKTSIWRAHSGTSGVRGPVRAAVVVSLQVEHVESRQCLGLTERGELERRHLGGARQVLRLACDRRRGSPPSHLYREPNGEGKPDGRWYVR